jgi:hypothetical protein
MIDNKEERVKQLTILFMQAVKAIETGAADNAVLIPFAYTDDVKVIFNNGSEVREYQVNAPK